MDDPIIARLRAGIGGYSAGERRVARVLLSAYPTAGLGTLAELATSAHVSNPTALRLLARLGFAGFSDFQRALRDELQERLATAAGSFEVDPSGEAPASRAMDAALRNLTADRTTLVAEEIQAVAGLLQTARSVTCMGGQLTQALAFSLSLQLDLLRPRCRFLGSSSSLPWNGLVDLGRRDVLAVFDFRSYEPAALDASRYARRRGARVLLFTDEWMSPVAAEATQVLVARVAAPLPFDSYASAISIVEAVLAELAERLDDRARARIAASEHLLEGHGRQSPDKRP